MDKRKVPGLEVCQTATDVVLYNADVDAIEDIGTIDTRFMERLGLEVAPTVANLTAFAVQGRFHADGSYHTLFSAAADYTNPQGIMVGASGDLTTLAAASVGWLLLDVRGIESIKIRAAGANTVLNIRGGGA